MWILLLVIGSFSYTEESCDKIELNHFHDIKGDPVYDQLIFYEYYHPDNQYYVRGWTLLDSKDKTKRFIKNYKADLYTLTWDTGDGHRKISSNKFVESWTQIDPERQNKKLLDERLRKEFVRVIKEKKPEPSVYNEKTIIE
jgi:hypothetical protein